MASAALRRCILALKFSVSASRDLTRRLVPHPITGLMMRERSSATAGRRVGPGACMRWGLAVSGALTWVLQACQEGVGEHEGKKVRRRAFRLHRSGLGPRRR
jgi:hypothetical protein